MSLINRMLQDLAKRGSTPESGLLITAPMPMSIRALPASANGFRWGRCLMALLVIAGISATIGWNVWHHAKAISNTAHSVPKARSSLTVPPAVAALAAAPLAAPVITADTPIAPAAINPAAVNTVPPTVAAAISDIGTTSAGRLALETPVASSSQLRTSKEMFSAVSTVMSTESQTVPPISAPATKTAARMTEKSARISAKKNTDSAFARDQMNAAQAKEITPQQAIDNHYRKALALIEAGQFSQAISVLEQVLQLEPRHAAARQTLVGLLVDAKRQEDALHKLQEGLVIDPAQTGMAMILARLQVEQGHIREALQTLQKSVSYATTDAQYQAFLGALLQRERMHKEAIEHYAIALRQAPENGLWWMGYGISLQAENRLPEAKDAFTKAQQSSSLSAELRLFVSQKLHQMTQPESTH